MAATGPTMMASVVFMASGLLAHAKRWNDTIKSQLIYSWLSRGKTSMPICSWNGEERVVEAVGQRDARGRAWLVPRILADDCVICSLASRHPSS